MTETLQRMAAGIGAYVMNGFKDEPDNDYPWPSENEDDDPEDDNY